MHKIGSSQMKAESAKNKFLTHSLPKVVVASPQSIRILQQIQQKNLKLFMKDDFQLILNSK